MVDRDLTNLKLSLQPELAIPVAVRTEFTGPEGAPQ